MRPHKRTVSMLAGAVAGASLLAGAAAAHSAPRAHRAGKTPIGAFTTKGAYSFVSAPKLHPPKLSTDTRTATSSLAPGFFMVANFPNLGLTQPAQPAKRKAILMIGQSGPLMLDNHLQPVWFAPVPSNVIATDLREQTYNGQPVLSWWQGVITNTGATLSGEDVVVDQHYREIGKPLVGQGGWVLSEHEMVLSGHFAWVTAYRTIAADLSHFGGLAKGTLLDAAVQEYDLTTGMLLGTWDAFNPGGKPNIPLSQSQQPVPEQSRMPWDAYHVNSISLVGGNEFLVSMRNTWAAYLVDAATGKIVWTLSANPKVVSSFKIARNAGFSWQHDVELQPGNIVSIFDDACCQLANGKIKLPTSPSRGLVLRLDPSRHTASLVAAYPDPHARQPDSVFLGNTDLLPGGHAVIGWGSTPFLSEFSRSGKLLLDAVWPRPDLSYRAFKQIWVGLPLYPPSGASVTSHGKTTVYASWNGATEVAAWRVLGGASGAAQLQVVVKRAGKTGFETAIPVPVKSATFEVEALNSAGAVIGTSRSFSVPNSGSGTGLPQSY